MNDYLTINNAASAASALREQMRGLDHEEVWALFLTSANTILGAEMLSRGTLTETSIDCRTILRQVLLKNAAALILLHNHPSGNPAPSAADIRFTEQLNRACKLMDVRLLDHVIVSEKAYFSFSEERQKTIEP